MTNLPDDARLHAYMDGQLTPQQAEQVLADLASHPQDAVRVLTWQDQRAQLRALQTAVLEEPVPAALVAALRPRAQRWPHALAAALLLGLGLGLGAGYVVGSLGWGAPAGRLAATPPAFVRDAAVAHVLYTPERRHPVEVGADQQAHLVQWLSKRLGTALRVPVLSEQGFALVGGRLLPGPGAEAGAASARAQFMYENAGGQRLTLYVSVFAPGAALPTGFQLAEQGAERSFYWLDGQQGYALTGGLPAETLAGLARSVYRQLSP